MTFISTFNGKDLSSAYFVETIVVKIASRGEKTKGTMTNFEGYLPANYDNENKDARLHNMEGRGGQNTKNTQQREIGKST